MPYRRAIPSPLPPDCPPQATHLPRYITLGMPGALRFGGYISWDNKRHPRPASRRKEMTGNK
ncbi:hypothetical protein GCM10028821_24450 [Hymenobacter jeollabukensis]